MDVRVEVLGSALTGKTSFILSASATPEPTSDDEYNGEVEVNGNVCYVSIFDIFGQVYAPTRNHEIWQASSIRAASVCILMYSIISRQSFSELVHFRDTVG